MLYELVGIASVTPAHAAAKQAVTQIGRMIIGNRGVVRLIECWRFKPLPQIMKANQKSYVVGDYFYMKFDCSPGAQGEIMRAVQADPRLIRTFCVKLNEKSSKTLI
ncbi:37S ribosomal protein MRP17 [Yarrowia sp. C11]|nr:37S ribosomal protein MRP17 [Yarrowia sp. E02]KAG5372351.1 37S ribosomal protein MRP17 [Yarrowia sp. C11]